MARDRVDISEVFNYIYDPLTASIRVGESNFLVQKLFDYDIRADDKPVYIGYGVRGLATSATGWQIQKLTYDGGNRLVSIQGAVGIYDNRAVLLYS